MFSLKDDDDDDFMSTAPGPGRNNLASLFGMDKSGEQGSNASLTYTAPTEPKKTKPTESPSSQQSSSLLCACAVHAYKYIGSEYKSQGKLGAAIIGSHSPPEYRLLLYVSKQQQTTNARITSSFSFTVQPNNYAVFYDDSSERTSWSLMFETENNLNIFAKQIAICRANCSMASGPLDAVISQDMTAFSDPRVETGDSVEVRYSAWLLENHAPGAMFESNANAEKLLRFKVGKGKVITGLDTGVVGMDKCGKRFLVVPASLGYGVEGKPPKIPSNSVLLYEVEIVRAKFAKEKGGTDTPKREASPVSTPTKQTSSRASSEDTDEGVKARSRNLSESMSQPVKTDKAKLISRMAKMGQPMLPQGGRSRSTSRTDDDADEMPSTPTSAESNKPELPAKPSRKSSSPSPVQQPAAVSHAQHIPQQPVTAPVDPQQRYAQPLAQQGFGQPVGGYPPQGIAPVMQPMMANPNIMQGVPVSSQVSLYQQPGAQPGFGVPPYNAVYGVQPPYQQQPQPAPQPQAPAAAPTPPSATSDPSLPILLSETRQQNTELRLTLGRMSDKVDQMHQKIETLSSQQSGAVALPGSVPHTETAILLTNIQRIVQENERLKKEVFEKSSRIESQNEKIADLLQRNQQFVEQSNVMMEQRNDSFKTTTATTQARVLGLEQEKVHLTSELSSAMSQVGKLQLEISSLKKREMELQQSLDTATTSDQTNRDALTSLKLSDSENARKIDTLSNQIKEERQLRRAVELELNTLREEISEAKNSKAALEKNMAEKKKKTAEEMKKVEEEMEEQRTQHEKEVSVLKEKLRQQKTSTDAATAQQVKDIEAELNRDWQEKCDYLVKAANDKHKKEVTELKEELTKQQQLMKAQEEKFTAAKAGREQSEKRAMSLEDKVEELALWKEKYEKLRGQATVMKERYENRISELDSAAEERDAALHRVKVIQEKAREAVQRARDEAAEAVQASSGRDTNNDEVKKIMNTVYRDLKTKFEAKKSYSGDEVNGQVLKTIKEVTLKMLQGPGGSSAPVSESQESSESDDDTSVTEDDDDDSEEIDSKQDPKVNKDLTEIGGAKQAEELKENRILTEKEITVRKQDVKVTDKDVSSKSIGQNTDRDEVNEGQSNRSHVNVTGHEVSETKDDSTDTEKTIRDESFATVTDGASVVNLPGDGSGDVTTDGQISSNENNAKSERNLISDEVTQPEVTRKEVIQDVTSNEVSQPEVTPNEVIQEVSSNEVIHKVVTPNEVIQEVSSNEVIHKEVTPNEVIQEVSSNEVIHKEVTTNEVTPQDVESNEVISQEVTSTEVTRESRVQGEKNDEGASSQQELSKGDEGDTETRASQDADTGPEEKQSGEDAVEKRETAAITGDRGNPHYAAELDRGSKQEKTSLEDKISAMVETDKEPTNKAVDFESKIEAMIDTSDKAPQDKHKSIESTIQPTSGHVTGDRGNPHYAKELEKSQPHSSLEAQIESLIIPGDDAKGTDEVINPVSANISGDKGNPHYAKELEKNKPASTLEAQIESMLVSGDGDVSTKRSEKEQPLVATQAAISGDKGNPHYAKELEAKSLEAQIEGLIVTDIESSQGKSPPRKSDKKEVPIEEDITPESLQVTGDKGNPYYAAELRKDAKDKNLESRIESMILPGSDASSKQTSSLESQIESMILPSAEASKTSKSVDKIEASIVPSESSITGDRGNIHYAKELEKSKDSKLGLEGQIESLIVTGKDSSDDKSKKSEKDAKTSSGMESKIESLFSDEIEPAIKSDTAQVTGDKGNPYYKKELEEAGNKKDESKTAPTAPDKAAAVLSLFGEDEDDDFSFLQKPAEKTTTKKTTEKKANKSSKADAEDGLRQAPPPLFGDDDDDNNDLDWLS